ncbi:MAG: diacylglycerol kinase family protein [bacterium]|nr:diacylglycerol kinase family protein [bacterium]
MKRRALSFKYAFRGIFWVFKNQINFRIEVTLGILAILFSVFLKISPSEWLIVILLIAFVLSAEIFNSIIEEVASKFPIDHMREITKDMAAGFVLILAIASFIIGIIIFLPKILALL